MAQIDRKDIESGLQRKGFRRANGPHKMYYFYHNGKKTSIRTKISHGSDYKVYSDNLLNLVKKQLHLDTNKQLKDFFYCPLSETDYIQLLTAKDILKA